MRSALSAFWLLAGCLAMILLLGMFTARLRAARGIRSAPGYLGGIIWVIAMIGYAVLAKNEMADPLIFILVSAVIPLVYLINILLLLLSRRYTWQDPQGRRAYHSGRVHCLGVGPAARLKFSINYRQGGTEPGKLLLPAVKRRWHGIAALVFFNKSAYVGRCQTDTRTPFGSLGL